MRPKIIAHRGDREHYPENTISAFQSAIDKGVDAIELDAHMSQDRQLVIHHDYYLGTTNNGQGLVTSRSSKYLKSLDAGSWFSPEFAHEKIPFLTEVFTTFSRTICYEIELKGYTADFLQAVLDLVKKHHLLDMIEFTSPHPSILFRLKTLEPMTKIGMFVSEPPTWMTPDLNQAIVEGTALVGQVNVVHCPLSILSPEFVKKLQSLNIEVHVANCDSEDDLRKALSLEVNQLSTNKVDLAVAIVRI